MDLVITSSTTHHCFYQLPQLHSEISTHTEGWIASTGGLAGFRTFKISFSSCAYNPDYRHPLNRLVNGLKIGDISISRRADSTLQTRDQEQNDRPSKTEQSCAR